MTGPADGGVRATATGTIATTIAVLPAFLFGGLAPLIRHDLGFDERWIGVGVAVFFGTSALASVHGGRLGERVGARLALWIGIGGSVIAMAGVALLARSWLLLAGFLALGGVANAVIQPAANLTLARGVPQRRRGLAFGFKQSGVPAATAIGGFAIATVGVTLGWRGAFAGAAVLALAAVLLPDRDLQVRAPARPSVASRSDVPLSLILLAIGIGLGTAASNAMGAYLVEASIAAGWDPSVAGLTVGIGSLCGIATRVALGWLSDRVRRGHLLIVAGMLAVGGFGYACLAVLQHPVLLVLGTVISFVFGWGYNGLFIHAVVRLHEDRPAAATGVAQAGAFSGGVVGPPLFGVLVFATSYTFAWLTMVAFSLLAAGFVLWARRRIGREGAPTPR